MDLHRLYRILIVCRDKNNFEGKRSNAFEKGKRILGRHINIYKHYIGRFCCDQPFGVYGILRHPCDLQLRHPDIVFYNVL